MAKGKSTWKYNKLLTARRNYFDDGGTKGNIFQNAGADIKTAFTNPGAALSSPTMGMTSMLGAAAGAVGQIGGKLLSNGLSSKAGGIVSGVGDALGGIPIFGGFAKGALNLIGGGVNALFGSKLNQANINAANSDIDRMNSAKADAASFDVLSQKMASTVGRATHGKDFYGRDGVLSNKTGKIQKEMEERARVASERQSLALLNNAEDLSANQLMGLEANYAAFGGPMDFGGGAIGFDFMNRYIMAKEAASQGKDDSMTSLPNSFAKGGGIHIKPENKGKFTETKRRTGKTTEELTHSSNPLTRKRAIFAQNAKKWHHAFGGDLMTHGADFSNGIIQINSGGTHEQNPNEGVIFGMDQEGIPNLVEEGEVIFNDYVFSNRIKVPKTVRKRHRLTDGVTFADAAKELAKESEERPNDPISQNGLEYLMGDLMTEQEMIKAKREKNTFSKGGRVHKYADGTPDLGLLDRPIDMTDFSWMEELNKATNPTGKGRNTKASNRLFDIANMRYIPALGAAIGVTTDLLGITNKPDYEPANMVLEASKGMGAAPSVRFNPIGNYLTYKPFDRDYYTNKMSAEAGATRRALLQNAGMNRGAGMAAILATDNNAQNQLGSLARQAEEYNLAQRQQVETFNRATNQYNSEGALKADIANAENRLKTANLRMESTIAGAKMRQAAKDASDLARSTNLTNLFDSLGNIGWEEYQRNAIESNPALSGYYQSRTGNIGYNPRRAKGGFLTIKKRRK